MRAEPRPRPWSMRPGPAPADVRHIFRALEPGTRAVLISENA
ncbi:MAG TPA: hypothetical protein VK586_23835 [Streptosporangiaceae bacterium]|nr:hypothetical protein [Streptosporangiaceae bacterium]